MHRRTDDAEELRRGLLAGVGAYGLWGLFPLYFHALDAVAPLEVLANRILWSLVTAAGLAALAGDRSWWRRLRDDRSVRAVSVTTGTLIAANWLTYIWAVANDRVLEAALGYYISPLVAVAVGVGLYGEHLRRMQWAAVGLGIVAVGVLTVSAGRPPWVALVLAASFTGFAIGKRRIPLGPTASLAAETLVVVPVALAILVVMGARGTLSFGDDASTTALLVLAGPVTAAPLLAFAAAARRVPLSVIGLLQYLTPTLQFLCAVVVLGETLSRARWAGFALVWGALALLSADAALRTRRVAAAA